MDGDGGDDQRCGRRISKKKPTYLIADGRGWLVNADPGKCGSYGERGWMRSVLVISAVD